MSLKIDQAVDRAELTLSKVAACPVIGTLAGLAKVLVGVAQTVSAIVFGILALIPSLIMRDGSKLKWAGMHIKHGLANVVVGALESIPIIQTSLFLLRRMRNRQWAAHGAYISYGQEMKFMPYSSIQLHGCTFKGDNEEALQRLHIMLKGLTTKYDYTSRYEAMNTAINNDSANW